MTFYEEIYDFMIGEPSMTFFNKICLMITIILISVIIAYSLQKWLRKDEEKENKIFGKREIIQTCLVILIIISFTLSFLIAFANPSPNASVGEIIFFILASTLTLILLGTGHDEEDKLKDVTE